MYTLFINNLKSQAIKYNTFPPITFLSDIVLHLITYHTLHMWELWYVPILLVDIMCAKHHFLLYSFQYTNMDMYYTRQNSNLLF